MSKITANGVEKIENYPPGNTLVATPEKMQKFYRDTSVATDTHPWNGMHLIFCQFPPFDVELTLSIGSQIYSMIELRLFRDYTGKYARSITMFKNVSIRDPKPQRLPQRGSSSGQRL